MTYAVTVLAAACCVLGFLLVCALVGGSEQRDELQAKVEHRDARIEDLENELRHRSRGNHPAGRGLREDGPPPPSPFAKIGDPRPLAADVFADNVIALREALEDRDANTEPCAEFGQHPRGGHERAVKQAVDFRGRTGDCLPFCQGGLHEVGCPSLEPAATPEEPTP